MDLEPIQSLAFSMRARPKLYALLLGSGVSRAAGIPTGWEVVLDLVKKLMVMEGAETSDPQEWYRGKYGSDPNYSDLIERIAPNPPERQQILRQYWESAPEDVPDASKRPTAAHQAIADLVKSGFVKVIITTNFDRLIENALREVGVEPVVLRSPDDIIGMMPLDHTDCCIIKLHGDYLDERIRNTTDELSGYPVAVNDILDRILDEYGLVVCGWSGAWDIALNKAIRRSRSRRYATYWTAHDALGDEAKHIIQAREARVIEIKSADGFFGDLSSLVRSLEDSAKPHPLSVQAAVAQCKQLLARDEDRIRLADFVDSIGEEAIEGISALPTLHNVDGAALAFRMRRCEGICAKLLAVAVVASYWSEEVQIAAWRNTIERFFSRESRAGTDVTMAVENYPAVLLIYALGLGATASDRFVNLARVLGFSTGHGIDSWTREARMKTEEEVAHGLGRIMSEVAGFTKSLRALEGMERRHFPMNEWLFRSLREHTTGIMPSDAHYERVFDKVEVLLALGCGVRDPENRKHGFHWFPYGCFIYRRELFNATIGEIEESLKQERNNSPFVNFVGSSATDGMAFLKSFRDFVSSVRREFHIRG